MHEVTTVVTHAAGLHARPASMFVQLAKRYAAAITVRNGERQANAKSIVQVLTLGAKQGVAITIQAEGDDSEQAVAALKGLVDANFEAVV